MSATTSSVVATAAIVTVGKWSQDETLDVKVVGGGAFLALGLALLDRANPTLASRFALLILVVAMFMYVPAIAYEAGLTKRKPPRWR